MKLKLKNNNNKKAIVWHFFRRNKQNTTAINHTGKERAGVVKPLCFVHSILSTPWGVLNTLTGGERGRAAERAPRSMGTRVMGTRGVPGLGCSKEPWAHSWGSALRDFKPLLQEHPVLVGATSTDPPPLSCRHVRNSLNADTEAQAHKHKTLHYQEEKF